MAGKIYLMVLLYSISYVLGMSRYSLVGASSNRHRCVPVTIKECKALGYDNTRPVDMYSSISMNLKNGKKYIEKLSSVSLPSYLKSCAKDAIFLMCSVYSPICFKGHKENILPCKSVCNRLKENCGFLLNTYGIELPEEMKCDNLPEHNSGVCIQPSTLVTAEQALKQRSKNSSYELPVKKCECNSKKLSRKPRNKSFRKARYVIEASITSRATLANGHSKIIVNVTKIWKSGKIQVKLGKMRLWSPTSCLCQKVEYDVKYIIMGTENTKRLVIDKDTYILPYKEYESKVAKWKRKCEKRGRCPKSKTIEAKQT